MRRGITVDTIKATAITFFDWTTAAVIEDTRKDYGERRFRALGFIGRRLHAVVYTPRPAGLHVISLRKANRREEKHYAAQTESGTG